jgi:hypothetical protein
VQRAVRKGKRLGRAPCLDTTQQGGIGKEGSSQGDPRHTGKITYRCFLPDLTGFGNCLLRGARLSTPPLPGLTLTKSVPQQGIRSRIKRISGYRAPLVPHLARPSSSPIARARGDVRPAHGGERGIRTLEAACGCLHDFQSCSLGQLGHLSAGGCDLIVSQVVRGSQRDRDAGAARGERLAWGKRPLEGRA